MSDAFCYSDLRVSEQQQIDMAIFSYEAGKLQGSYIDAFQGLKLPDGIGPRVTRLREILAPDIRSDSPRYLKVKQIITPYTLKYLLDIQEKAILDRDAHLAPLRELIDILDLHYLNREFRSDRLIEDKRGRG